MRSFLINKENKEYGKRKQDRKTKQDKKIQQDRKMQKNRKMPKDKKMQKTQYRGSYTVEAAILMPCIIFFLMAMLYTFFFFHDLLVVEAQLSVMTLQGEDADKDSKKEMTKTKINERTYVSDLTDITKTSSSSVILSSEEEYQGIVKTSVPMEGMREWVEAYIHQRETRKVKNNAYDFCKNVRRAKELCKIVNKGGK